MRSKLAQYFLSVRCVKIIPEFFLNLFSFNIFLKHLIVLGGVNAKMVVPMVILHVFQKILKKYFLFRKFVESQDRADIQMIHILTLVINMTQCWHTMNRTILIKQTFHPKMLPFIMLSWRKNTKTKYLLI